MLFTGETFDFGEAFGELHSIFVPLVNPLYYGSMYIFIRANRYFGDNQSFEANCFIGSNWPVLLLAFILRG